MIGKARSLFKFVVDKAKGLAGKVGNKLGFGKNKDKGADDTHGIHEETDPEHDRKVKEGLAYLRQEESRYAKNGRILHIDALANA